MIAPLEQPQRFEPAPYVQLLAQARALSAQRRRALLAGAMGFACFMPYPALNVGNSTAIQIGNVITLLMALPCLLVSWKRRPFHFFPLLLAPLLLSALRIALTDSSDAIFSFKEISVWAISGVAMLATQIYAPAYALEILTGIALATIVHVAVGGWQYYAFGSSQFPLVDLYVNQSFLSVQDNATIIARYVQRPFGLFPEPSAMSASLAPFVLFWTSHLCGVIRLRREPSGLQKKLFAAAAAGAMGLMIVSRSGHAAVTLAAVLLFIVIWFIRARATAGTYAVIVALFGVALPVVIGFAAAAISERLSGNSNLGNSSWEERTNSLLIGFGLLMDRGIMTAICGVGPGLMSPAMWSAVRINAVFSVFLTYLYETGMLGMIAVSWIAQHLIRGWRSLRYDVSYIVFALVWLVGITLTTSYEQLLPIWIALGWLSVWPAICEPARGTVTTRATSMHTEAETSASRLRWSAADSASEN